MSDLRMWTAEHEEWVIAASAEDAAECYRAMAGEPLEWAPGEPAVWTEEPMDKVCLFREEDGSVTARSNAEWIREKGRGHFASANI